ncbi:MAG: hypothetical protein ACI898_000865 [Flavobacteriales bacterium]|jgi:hypothetical protein
MIQLKKWLLIGITLEAAIFLIAYLSFSDLGEVFCHAARYSGRLSLIVYLIAIWHYMASKSQSDAQLTGTRSITMLFFVLHYIHLFLLGMNVNLNAVTLIPFKLAGGALAYLMILLYPLFFERIKHKKAIHAIYFLYVGFVMAMTYIARMNGNFEGAAPERFHKVGLAVVLASMAFFIYRLMRPNRVAI